MIVEKWNKYLDKIKIENKTLYSSEEYCKLYDNESHKSLCFVYENDDKTFIFPFLSTSVPRLEGYKDFETHYGYGGAITSSTDSNFIENAFSVFKSELKEMRFIAGFIRFNPLLDNFNIVGKDIVTFFDRKTVAIDLTMTEDDIWQNQIHSKHRNVIRKAESHKLDYIVDFDFNYIDDFLCLYKKTMERLNATDFYYFDDDYYKKFIRDFKDKSFLAVIKKDDVVISCAIIMYDDFYGHYHLAGSNPDYLGMCPNNFMLYKTALLLKEKGIKTFHLGGGTTSDENDSLYLFKKRFNKLSDKSFHLGKFLIDKENYENAVKMWEEDLKSDKTKSGLFLKYRY